MEWQSHDYRSKDRFFCFVFCFWWWVQASPLSDHSHLPSRWCPGKVCLVIVCHVCDLALENTGAEHNIMTLACQHRPPHQRKAPLIPRQKINNRADSWGHVRWWHLIKHQLLKVMIQKKQAKGSSAWAYGMRRWREEASAQGANKDSALWAKLTLTRAGTIHSEY